MRRWAATFAKNLREGGVVYLEGPLGAGKTTLVSFFVAGLGSIDLVTSPTFALVHEYEGPLRIVHMDLYRLGSAGEFWEMGGEDYLAKGNLVFIEWPDRVRAELPPPRWELRLDFDGNGRVVEVVA